MTSFALLIAILLSFFSYEMISFFQRKTAIQATEFNLQLISHVIDQDLTNLYALAMICSTNSSTNTLLAHYFESPQASAKDAVNAFASMQEAFRVNPSNTYVRRLVVTDHQGKFIQLDNAGGLSSLLTVHNIDKLPGLHPDATEEWGRVIRDPFSSTDGIPFIYPIYGTGAARVGTIYLLANTSVITDKLKGYSLPGDSRLMLRLGELNYGINGGRMEPVSADYKEKDYVKDSPTGIQTSLSLVEAAGQERIAVSYPVRSGVTLKQTLSGNQLFQLFNSWILIMIGVCFLVIALSAIITLYLTRTISLPVEKLKKRIDKISQGYFYVDKNIEWNSELGDVGRGINRLSQDIVVLMESRVADVQQKQELEYRMLQYQISPHFLYNTLNSVKWMATIQNATGIAEMVTSLSRLLRSISKDIRKVVQLKDELSLLEDYFIIQKYRYGSTITIEQRIGDPNLLLAHIPRFSLQPLVENAIFHGIEPKGRGHIVVTVEACEERDIRVTIEDNGIGMSNEQISSILSVETGAGSGLLPSIGLRSVNERLRLAFGDKYGLSIESMQGHYTKMSLLLPAEMKAQ